MYYITSMLKDYYTVTEFKTLLKSSRQWVYSLMHRKKIDWIQLDSQKRLILKNKKSQKYIKNANLSNVNR